MRRAGIVLCGGRSHRMGRPKALLPWFGSTLLEHVVARIAPGVDEIVVVTARDLLIEGLVKGLGARVVFDRESERGPLAALRDGLAATTAEHAFVTATDAPCVTASAARALFERAEAGARAGRGRAVVPRAGGILQVLSAVYPRTAGHEAAALLEAAGTEAARARGSRAGRNPEREPNPMQLLERIGFDAIEASDVVAADQRSSLPAWTSFNSPDEYLTLARHHDPAACASIEWIDDRLHSAAVGPLAPHAGRDEPDGAVVARVVPIGLLGEILRAAAPPGFSLDDPDALAGLAISFGDASLRVEGVRPEHLALPVGPGERLRVRAR